MNLSLSGFCRYVWQLFYIRHCVRNWKKKNKQGIGGPDPRETCIQVGDIDKKESGGKQNK